jgi:hypothetical protein
LFVLLRSIHLTLRETAPLAMALATLKTAAAGNFYPADRALEEMRRLRTPAGHEAGA